jgi:hypothetical protein
MGWGLILNNVYLNRVRKDDLLKEKQENEDYLNSLKLQICNAVAYTNPIISYGQNEDMSLLNYASFEIPNLLGEITETSFRLALINFAIDNPGEVIGDE